MVAIIEKRSWRDFDWLLAILAVSIVSFGVWQIYNAQPTENYWEKQIIGLFIALIALVVIAMTDYRRLIEAAPFITPPIGPDLRCVVAAADRAAIAAAARVNRKPRPFPASHRCSWKPLPPATP